MDVVVSIHNFKPLPMMYEVGIRQKGTNHTPTGDLLLTDVMQPVVVFEGLADALYEVRLTYVLPTGVRRTLPWVDVYASECPPFTALTVENTEASDVIFQVDVDFPTGITTGRYRFSELHEWVEFTDDSFTITAPEAGRIYLMHFQTKLDATKYSPIQEIVIASPAADNAFIPKLSIIACGCRDGYIFDYTLLVSLISCPENNIPASVAGDLLLTYYGEEMSVPCGITHENVKTACGQLAMQMGAYRLFSESNMHCGFAVKYPLRKPLRTEALSKYGLPAVNGGLVCGNTAPILNDLTLEFIPSVEV